MFPRVKRVRHVKDYTLEISFTNGTVANLDLRARIAGRGGMFEPLQNE